MKVFGSLFGSKKKNVVSEQNRRKIQNEIESLQTIKNMLINKKEFPNEFLIDVCIERNIIPIDSESAKEKVPESIIFLIIVDNFYPEHPPKILTKSNFCSPSLMDGRDLLKDIYPDWNIKTTLHQVVDNIVPFLSKIINAKGYKFYGTFHLGSTYNLKNFDNMIVVILECSVEENDDKKLFINSLKKNANYILILTEDCFLLFEKLDSGNGIIVFWSSLFAITDLQLNKRNKVTSINFYDEESNQEFQLKLKIDNILLFRDSLVKRLRYLKVKDESQKLIKGQHNFKRITEKEMKAMKINDIEKNIEILGQLIEKGEINDYTVNTYTNLCGKAIEHFSMIGDEKYLTYMEKMKNVLNNEKVEKLTKEDEKAIKELGEQK